MCRAARHAALQFGVQERKDAGKGRGPRDSLRNNIGSRSEPVGEIKGHSGIPSVTLLESRMSSAKASLSFAELIHYKPSKDTFAEDNETSAKGVSPTVSEALPIPA